MPLVADYTINRKNRRISSKEDSIEMLDMYHNKGYNLTPAIIMRKMNVSRSYVYTHLQTSEFIRFMKVPFLWAYNFIEHPDAKNLPNKPRNRSSRHRIYYNRQDVQKWIEANCRFDRRTEVIDALGNRSIEDVRQYEEECRKKCGWKYWIEPQKGNTEHYVECFGFLEAELRLFLGIADENVDEYARADCPPHEISPIDIFDDMKYDVIKKGMHGIKYMEQLHRIAFRHGAIRMKIISSLPNASESGMYRSSASYYIPRNAYRIPFTRQYIDSSG